VVPFAAPGPVDSARAVRLLVDVGADRRRAQVLDRIAGFKHYLSVTERERLDRLTPPKDTPELFERYLPYAIALGVENRWAKRFAGVLAAAAAQGQQGFAWYSGSQQPMDRRGALHPKRRIVACNQRQLGIHRSRVEQRLGRRRLVGRWWRRWRWWRLVFGSTPGRAL
jgi:hypothetical protein